MGGLNPFPDVSLHILDDSKLVWSQDWKGAELMVVSYIVISQSGKQCLHLSSGMCFVSFTNMIVSHGSHILKAWSLTAILRKVYILKSIGT